jgi:hypothetical protein
MNLRKIISSIAIGAGAVVIGLGIQYASADWNSAPSSPPNSNVPAPINVGSNSQSKLGQLLVNTDTSNPFATGLEAFGKSIFTAISGSPAIQIIDGKQAQGSLLQSDASGNAKWVATSTLGFAGSSSGVTKIIAGTGINISPTSGTGNVTINASTPSGTVGGGCYSHPSGSGNVSNFQTGRWGNASGNGGSCTCPTGYSAQFIATGPSNSTTGASGSDSYLCIAN